MPKDAIDSTFEHLAKLTDSRPTLMTLLYMRDLWAQLRHYWDVFSGEIERRRGKSHPIRALDFDLIYPTVWPATVQSPLKLEERMGFPMTASFVFRDTKTFFTIPPGAFFELSFHILKLQESYRLTEGSLNRLMRKIDDLHREAVSAQTTQALNAKDILRETLPACTREIDKLIDVGAKLESLNNILTHEYYRPWDQIADQAEASADSTEILKLWRIFSAARSHPDKDLSNYLDALSVASYYSLSRAQAGGRFRDFPLLASGTHVVLNLGPQVIGTSGDYLPSLLQDIIHPVSIQYLAFATAMERYAEYDIARQSTLAEAGLREIHKLFRRWRTFWTDCRVTFPQPEHVKEEDHYLSISFSQLSGVPSFHLLCEAYKDWRFHFENTVGGIFINITKSDQQISESYHRTRQRLLERIEQSQTGASPPRPAEVLVDITKTFNWTPLTDVADTGFLLLGPVERPAHQRLYDETIQLLTLRRTGMLTEEAEVIPDPIPTLRTTIKLSDIKDESLLTWERSVGHDSQLCYWSYRSNIQEVFEQIGIFLIDSHRKSTEQSPIHLHIFADELYEHKIFEDGPLGVKWFDEILSVTSNPNYFRMDTSVCSVFLDAMPAKNATHLEMAVMYKKDIHRQVATLYRQTSVFPFALSVIKSVLREFAQDFKRKEALIVSLAKAYKERKTS
jgi:hypothetical protein